MNSNQTLGRVPIQDDQGQERKSAQDSLPPKQLVFGQEQIDSTQLRNVNQRSMEESKMEEEKVHDAGPEPSSLADMHEQPQTKREETNQIELSCDIIESILLYENICTDDRPYFLERLDILENQLSFEKRLGKYTKEKLGKLRETNKQSEVASILKEILKKIKPFSISLTRDITKIDDICIDKIKDQEIILFFGGTGSGKSTTITYLTGCEMEMVKVGGLDHIQAKSYPPGCDEELKNVKSSPHAVSETSNVRAIRVTYEKKKAFGKPESIKIFICDCPGQLDTRGYEQDIAQARGIIRAAHNSKTVRVVIAISKLGIGDRGEGFRKIANVIADMLTNLQETYEAVDVIFTKYQDSNEEREAIYAKMSDIYGKLEEGDEFQDSTFKEFFEMIGSKIEEKEKILIPDLFDSSKREKMLSQICQGKKIEEPKSTFKMSISLECQSALSNQAQIDMQNFQLIGLELHQTHIIERILQDYQYMSNEFELQIMKETLTQLIDTANHFLAQKKENSQRVIFEFLDSGNVVTKDMAHKIKEDKEKLVEMNDVLKRYTSELDTQPGQYDQIIGSLLSTVSKNVLNITEPDHILKPSVKQALTSMNNVVDVFATGQIKKNLILDKCITFCQNFEAKIFKEAQKDLEQQNFFKVQEKITFLRKIKDHIGDFLSNHDLASDLISFTDKFLDGFYSKSKAGIEKLDHSCQLKDFQEIYKQFKVIEKASKQLTLAELEHIKDKVTELTEICETKFSEDVQTILRAVNGEEGMQIEKLAALQPNMRSLKNFHDSWESLDQNLVREYIKIWSNFTNYLNTSAQIAEEEISRGYNFDYELKGSDVIKNLNIVEGLLWIDELEGQKNVEITIERIKKSINDYLDNYLKKADRVIMDTDWKSLIIIHAKLHIPDERYNEYQKKLKDYLIVSVKARFELIDKLEKSISNHYLPLNEISNSLQFLLSLKEVFGLLDTATQGDSKLMYEKLESFLIEKFKQKFKPQKLKDMQDVQDIFAKLEEIEEIRKSKKLIEEIFKISQYKEVICTELVTQVNSFQMEANRYQRGQQMEELEKLVDGFHNFMELDSLLRFANKDKFSPDELAVNFRKLIHQFEFNIDTSMRDTLKELTEELQKEDIIIAIGLMEELRDPYRKRAKKLVNSSIQRLIRDANNKAMKLGKNSDKGAYNDNQEIYNKLKNTRDYIQPQSSQEELKQSSDEQERQMRSTVENIDKQLKKSVTLVNSNLCKRLDKIKENIAADNFYESLQQISDIDECISCLDELLSKETRDKKESIDQDLEKQFSIIVKKYTEKNFADYHFDPLKDLFEKLELVSGNNKSKKAMDDITKKVYSKYTNKLKELKDKGQQLERGLKNQEFRQLENSLSSLPPKLKEGLKIYFDDFKTEFEEETLSVQSSFIDNLENISEDRIQDIKKTIASSRKNKNNGLTNQAITKIKATIDSSILAIIESKNEKTIRTAQTIGQKYKEAIIYKELENDIPAIKKDLEALQKNVRSIIFESVEKSRSVLEKYKIHEQLSESDIKELLIHIDFLDLLEKQELPIENKKSVQETIENLVEITQKLYNKLQSKDAIQPQERITEFKQILSRSHGTKDFIDQIQSYGKILGPKKLMNYSDIKNSIEAILAAKVKILEKPFESQDKYLNLNEEGAREKHFKGVVDSLEFFEYAKELAEHKIQVKFNGNLESTETIAKTVQKDIVNQVSQKQKFMKDSLKADSVPEANIKQINKDISHVNTFLKQFSTYSIPEVQQEMDVGYLQESSKIINEKINKQMENFNQEQKIEVLTKSLIEMKKWAESIPVYKKDIDKQIDEFIKKNTGKNKQISTAQLSTFINDENCPEAKSLINDHSVFTGTRIAFTNTLIHNPNYGKGYVKQNTTSNKAMDKDKLEKLYNEFESTYGYYDDTIKAFTGILDKYLRPKADINILIRETTGLIPKNLKANSWKKSEVEKVIPKIVANIFGVWTVISSKQFFEQGSQHDGVNYLLQPHAAQVMSIFRILGLGHDKKVEKNTLQNHLVQIKTGEGKSITLAVASIVLALLGFEVYCVCYSKYLSERDYNDSKELFRSFKVEQLIKYGTFGAICEEIINERGDLRSSVNQFVESGKNPQSKKQHQREKALIIDEVDVFFDMNFYGKIYQPMFVLKSPAITQLMKLIWQQRDSIKQEDIESLNEFQDLQKKYPLFQDLLKEAVKDMIFEVKQIDTHTGYVVRDDKIMYLVDDEFTAKKTEGYLTSFSYFKEFENGTITEGSVNDYMGMLFNCGHFSYSKMIESFNVVLGVTGTLDTLSETQKHIVENEYNIHFETMIPSVYGRNNLQFSTCANVSCVLASDHYSNIQRLIQNGLKGREKGQRAVLVFFKTKEDLLDFFNSKYFEDKKDKAQFLTEYASPEEKQQVVRKSTQSGQITLLTSSYGRGTDFLVQDEEVLAQGGLCTIQTFPSSDLSEEVQTKGRSARRGQEGSYYLAITFEQLDYFDISMEDAKKLHERNDGSLYKKFDEKRNSLFESKFKQYYKLIQNSSQDHKESQQFRDYIFSGQTKKVIDYLIRKNLGRVIPKTQPSKTMVLIDATCSMSGLLNKVITTVKDMLGQTQDVLSKEKLDPNLAEIKIAVYRNYNVEKEKLYQSSGWETRHNALRNFLEKFAVVDGGWGNEAVEAGLHHAVKEIPDLTQVLIIGDMPPNTKDEFSYKREEEYGEQYWKDAYPGMTYYEPYVNQLKSNSIPIHTVMMTNSCKKVFGDMSQKTGGKSFKYNDNDNQASQHITEIIVSSILSSVGGSEQGKKLVETYKKSYKCSFI